MKRRCFYFCYLLFPLLLFGQNPPRWINNSARESAFPSNVFYTAFLSENASSQETFAQMNARLENAVKRKISESIRVKVRSEQTIEEKSFQSSSGVNRFQTDVQDNLHTSSDAELVGIKTETYFDQSARMVYAFAYVNKYELIGYYKSNLSVNIGQIESVVKTAQDLEANGEKAQARRQLENANSIFSKIRYVQDLLTAVDVNASAEDLQQGKTETLYNTFIQMQARLAQAVYVYVESSEDLFGQKVDIVANRVKAELAKNGCSFVENAEEADYLLKINVSTRTTGNFSGMIFCYADTQIDLYDVYKQKTIYSNEISQKGGSNTQEKAGRKAMEDVVLQVVQKLKQWINI